jgi:hypothetical protein
MCDEFTHKDFLSGLPKEAPWQIVEQIKGYRNLVEADTRGITRLPSSAQTELLGLCYDFNSWASVYFESEEAPWERNRAEDMRTISAKLKPWLLVFICVLALLAYFASR